MIVSPINDASLQVMALPPGQPDFGMSADKVLRVKSSIASSKAALYEVEIGQMVRRNPKVSKRMFVADEGVPPVAMKIHEWKVRISR